MEFKDKLIEKLQNELDKFNEHRNRSCRDNLELVNDTLCRLFVDLQPKSETF